MFQSNLLADGSTSVIKWRGGEGAIIVEGTFGSGTLTLQWRFTGATWASLGIDTVFTSQGIGLFAIPEDIELRATLSGATNPNITVTIR